MSNSQQPGPPGSEPPGPLPTLEALLTQPFSKLAKVSDVMPIRWDELSRPPFFVPRKFLKSDIYRGSMAYSVIQLQWRAQRTLTDEETQIVAMQKAKYLNNVAYALPAIVGTAVVYTTRGRDTYRFPFYTPGDKFRSNVFPYKGSVWLRGVYARAMWHSCRLAAYLAVSQWAISSFFVSYALTVRQAEFDGDPRLNSLRSSIKQAATERMANSKNPHTRMLAEKVQQSEQARATQPPRQPVPQSRQPDLDDQSPQDQQFQSDQQLEDERYQKEQQQYQQEYQPPNQQRYPPQYQQAPSSQRPAQLPWAQKRDDDDGGLGLDDYDDGPLYDEASPVAPTEQRRKWQKPNSSSGSSWDRLRTQATAKPGPEDERDVPAQGSKWSRVRANASPDADSSGKTAGDYMYNLRDEEKTFAKDKAQRDFDAMLDKERQGENDADARRKW